VDEDPTDRSASGVASPAAQAPEVLRRNLDELRLANEVIAAQKRALERSEARWRSLVESAQDFVLLLDRDGRVLFINRLGERGGMRLEDLLGHRLQSLATGLQSERIDESVRLAGQERRSTCWEGPWTGPSGEPGFYNLQFSPVIEDHRVTGVLLVVRDVTAARKEQEARLELERRVLHAQKLESLGILAGGIAHDFNNLLAGIVSNAGMAGMCVETGSEAAKYLERVESGAMRAAALVDQMLAYAGKGRFEVGAVDLSKLIGDLVALLKAGLPKNATVTCRLAAELPAVEGDASQLQQVVMNLVTNAAEALEGERGEVVVETGTVILPEDRIPEPLPPEVRSGVYVYVAITDTGRGMDAATLGRIFEPFFSTKRTGRGLGLAAVQGIVVRHGGGLAVRSAPGKGTTFRMLLPISARGFEEAEEPDPDAASDARGTVLVVDDEPTVRDGARSLLEHHGYGVLVAGDGDEALRVFSERPEAVDVVLLDKTMPGPAAADVFRALRRLRPDVAVILSSAYDAGDLAAQLTPEGLKGFLRKPYRQEALLAAIRSARSL
jgi:two-component system cell cycle sensor histidine kinase/response regulator CckA